MNYHCKVGKQATAVVKKKIYYHCGTRKRATAVVKKKYITTAELENEQLQW